MAATPYGGCTGGEEIARHQYGSGPSHDRAAVGKGRCQGPVLVGKGGVSEGVPGRPAQDAIVVKDATPGGARRGAVVLPDRWEVEAELIDGGLQSDAREGSG